MTTTKVEPNPSVLSVSRNPRGLSSLADWSERDDVCWSRADKRNISKNKPFSFHYGRDVLIVKDGKVGNLKQWAHALGLAYSTVTRRRMLGWPLELVLSTRHQALTDHAAWPATRRKKCTCLACKAWVIKQQPNRPLYKETATADGFILAAPSGVAEPRLWKKQVPHGRNFFLFKGEFRSLAQWAKWRGISENTLHARLVHQGMPIERAMADELRPLVHGTRHGYIQRGCRCPECREANSAYHRALAQAKKRKQSR